VHLERWHCLYSRAAGAGAAVEEAEEFVDLGSKYRPDEMARQAIGFARAEKERRDLPAMAKQ
jgi:hypothetical protein